MILATRPELQAPDGSVIGVLVEGRFEAPGAAWISAGEALPSLPGNYVLDHTLARASAIEKAWAVAGMLRLRRQGATFLLISFDEPLLEACADEIWWIEEGALVARGDPAEVLAGYRKHVAGRLRSAGMGQALTLSPTMRKGDGRAELAGIELLGQEGEPSTVWRSGEMATVEVTVRFAAAVAEPVVGIMIRTRIGLNVYGTNTELEQLRLGPVEGGEAVSVAFRFRCDLCPGDYTITAASHDPDGLWHDWMEDAVAFSVTDSRYTAGVANLRAQVTAKSYGHSAST